MKYGPVAAKAIQDQIQKDKILDASNGCTKVVSIVEYGSVPAKATQGQIHKGNISGF
jgi:hypothetical protein